VKQAPNASVERTSSGLRPPWPVMSNVERLLADSLNVRKGLATASHAKNLNAWCRPSRDVGRPALYVRSRLKAAGQTSVPNIHFRPETKYLFSRN
jgi:hypothetical protein